MNDPPNPSLYLPPGLFILIRASVEEFSNTTGELFLSFSKKLTHLLLLLLDFS